MEEPKNIPAEDAFKLDGEVASTVDVPEELKDLEEGPPKCPGCGVEIGEDNIKVVRIKSKKVAMKGQKGKFNPMGTYCRECGQDLGLAGFKPGYIKDRIDEPAETSNIFTHQLFELPSLIFGHGSGRQGVEVEIDRSQR